MQVPEFIGYRFTHSNADWQQAIHKCSEPLLKTGLIASDYVDAIISETLENGPWYIISPGFALPHARPEQGVLTTRTSFSLLRLAHPVVFDNGDPASLFIILAAGSGQQHIKAITQLFTWLDDGRLENILHASNQAELDLLLVPE
jgi:PTS system ascorbate-specific IIA component